MEPRQLFMATLILAMGMLVGWATNGRKLTITIPNLTTVAAAFRGPTPIPGWVEKTATLSAEEQATAAAYFPSEFESAIASAAAMPTMTPIPTPAKSTWLTVTVMPSRTPTPGTSPTPTPAVTPDPLQTPAGTPTPAPSPTPVPTPMGQGDTTPPSVTVTGGPENGAVVAPGTYCYPLWIVDNLSWYSAVQTRMAVDGGAWTDWSAVYQYCPAFAATGTHTVKIQGKDEAGNVSAPVTRTLTVRQP
jgi:hypothetical protein